jgi:glyoxylase-like metal-dependent hydrolase (beta-lactamase superfamily II)
MAAQEEPTIKVQTVAEGVYLFSYNIHNSLFVVADDVVLVTDPQNNDAAQVYLEEIRKITQAPIRYMVYSHRHGDHISGGGHLGSGFTTIGHVNYVGASRAYLLRRDRASRSEFLRPALDIFG